MPWSSDATIGYVGGPGGSRILYFLDMDMLRSTDFGDTWEIINDGVTPGYCRSIPEYGNILTFAMENPAPPWEGFYYSANADELDPNQIIWRQRNGSINYALRTDRIHSYEIYYPSVESAEDDEFFVILGRDTMDDPYGDEKPLFRTLDGGESWHPAYLLLPLGEDPNIIDIDLYQGEDSEEIIVLAANLDGVNYSGGIYKSVDSGINWEMIGVDPPAGYSDLILSVAMGQKSYESTNIIYAGVLIAAGPYDPSYIRIYKSVASGTDWEVVYELPGYYAAIRPLRYFHNDDLLSFIPRNA